MKHLTTFTLATCLALLTSCMKEELVAPTKANTPDTKPDCVFPFAPIQQVTNDDPGGTEPAPLGMGQAPAGDDQPVFRDPHGWPPTIPDLQY
jgi:hypothetical protein